jgi:hypothetical protein
MKQIKIYNGFEWLNKKLGLRVIKGKGDFIGGKYTLNKQKIIVVNSYKRMEHRLKSFSPCSSRF